MARHHVGTYRYWGSIHDKSIAQTVHSCVFLFIFMYANKKKYFSEYHLKIRVKNVQYRFNLEQKSCGDKNIYFLQTFLLVGIYCRIINNVSNTFNSIQYYDFELIFFINKVYFWVLWLILLFVEHKCPHMTKGVFSE